MLPDVFRLIICCNFAYEAVNAAGLMPDDYLVRPARPFVGGNLYREMRYISTKGGGAAADAREALTGGFASDGGMFMPERLPRLPRAFFNNIGDMSMPEIAYVVASSFFGDDLDGSVIKRIVDESFGFDAPLVRLGGGYYALELFHGPTLTFKDYGARFVARTVGALAASRRTGRRTVLVATTGNSGAATANGLYGLPEVDVVVLYPKGVLSRMQMAQIATLGGNVRAVEVDGSIEDCKALVNGAMEDRTMEYLRLSTMNSLNIGRVIPQIVFSLQAYAGMLRAGEAGVEQALYSIPCGNLSNLIATLMAVVMGLPVGAVCGVCNANDGLGRAMRGEKQQACPVSTTAPSMDMAVPSGLPRLRFLLEQSPLCRGKLIVAPPVEDRDIAAAILRLRAGHGYTVDPHGAAAFAAAQASDHTGPKVIFATGHPAKSLDTMTRITGSTVELPVQYNRFMGCRRTVRYMPPTAAALRRMLITNS